MSLIGGFLTSVEMSKDMKSENSVWMETRRRAMGLKQKQFAEKAGISQQLYQYFESGKRSLKTCSFDTTCRVVAAFDYDIGEFFQNGCSFLKTENER